MPLALCRRHEHQHWPTDTRLTSHCDGTSDWSHLLMQEGISVKTLPRLSHFSVCVHLSVSLCLTFCLIGSLQGDAGRARSVWFRAVSRRRIESIYSPVCSGPHWLEVSVCFSVSVSLSFIYLISFGLPLILSYPQIKRRYPPVSSKHYLTVILSSSKVFNMVAHIVMCRFYKMLSFLPFSWDK